MNYLLVKSKIINIKCPVNYNKFHLNIMKRYRFINIWKVLVAVLLLITPYILSAQVQNLRCEYLTTPLGIGTPAPRFTWDYQSVKDFRQVSYKVLIASNPKGFTKERGDVWTSKKIDSSNSFTIYSGTTKLIPHTQYYWKVQVWDEKGKRHDSKITHFETAKFSLSDWKAEWISDGGDKNTRPSPIFRKTFSASKNIKKARVYISAQGYYEMWINGIRVGDKVLDPGYTHFDKRALYSSYDVTELVKSGENAVSAVLGNGFMNVQSLAVWSFENARWRQRPLMICELHIEYTDGEKTIVSSDKSWKTSTGPYIFNNIYSGDWYDARLEKNGWRLVDFDDFSWENAVAVKDPAPILESGMFAPVRVTQKKEAVSFKSISPSLYIVDLGINMSGFCSIKVRGDAGTEINVKYGERLYPNGRLDQSNIDVFFSKDKNHNIDLFQTDKFILKGDLKGEEFTPSFNYKGYQYLEIESSAPIILHQENIVGMFVHTDVEQVGHFSCSNDLLNQLWKAANQSYLSNLVSIPTDCPQREKNGWTGDAWIAIDLALLNYDGIKVYEKWMNDFLDNQQPEGNISGIIPSSGWGYNGIGPVWDAALFVIPKAIYDYYGDPKIIQTMYESCKKYLNFLKTREENGLIKFGLGDWLPYKTTTPSDFTSSCYYYHEYILMAEFAKILGEDNSSYLAKAAEIRLKINEEYLNLEQGSYANSSQTALALPLFLNIVPEDYEQKIADSLVKKIRSNNHFGDFGLLGTKSVLRVLTEYGYVEDAYKMITKTEEPSWGAWLVKRGMTTLPERWTIDDDPSLSYNHVFFGDYNAWFYNILAGINFDSESPGFEKIVIRPHFVKDLKWVKGEYRSVKGLISSQWKRVNNEVELIVSIPGNTTATIYIDKPIQVGGGIHKFVIKE